MPLIDLIRAYHAAIVAHEATQFNPLVARKKWDYQRYQEEAVKSFNAYMARTETRVTLMYADRTGDALEAVVKAWDIAYNDNRWNHWDEDSDELLRLFKEAQAAMFAAAGIETKE